MKGFDNKYLGLAAVAGAGLVTLVSVYEVVPSATAGISTSKHNLTGAVVGENSFANTNGDTQICVFCHTPHGSNQATADARKLPLWNKTLSTQTFSVYNSGTDKTSTLDSGVLAAGSVSLACLSCHDGTQAMDTMWNAPGPGGYTDGGARASGTWTAGSGGTVNTTTGKMIGDVVPVIGSGGDLKNDHPIGIQYCGGGRTVTATNSTVVGAGGTCEDGDFNSNVVNKLNGDGKAMFWVDLDSNNVRNKTDMILYTRDFTSKGGPAEGASVECASCHDPHMAKEDTAIGGNTVDFMRVTTSGSKICLSCHVK